MAAMHYYGRSNAYRLEFAIFWNKGINKFQKVCNRTDWWFWIKYLEIKNLIMELLKIMRRQRLLMRSARKLLDRMIAKGLIKKIGSGPATKYVIQWSHYYLSNTLLNTIGHFCGLSDTKCSISEYLSDTYQQDQLNKYFFHLSGASTAH